MTKTMQQFRVPSGAWHQSVRTNYENWLVGACLVNLDRRIVETRTTTEDATCSKCVRALAEHPEMHAGTEERTTADQTARKAKTPKRAKPGTLPDGSAKDAARGKTGERKTERLPKKQKVQKEPESPTLF